MGLTIAEKGLISQMLRFDSVNNELKTKLVAAEQLIVSFAEAVAKDEARSKELDQQETALRARETALKERQQRVNAELETECLKKEQQLQKLDETLTRKREVASFQAEQQIQKLNKELIQKREADTRRIEQDLSRREADTRQLEKLLEERNKRFPWLASAVADLAMLKNNEVADYLRTKRNPAFTAAETVRQVNQEKRNLTEQLKLAQYTLAQYESLFPGLADYREEGADEALLALSEAGESQQQDPVSSFLSSEEYNALSTTERNQRALDRYRDGRKTNYQLGRDYERYIGYLYESKGYAVEYYGIENGLADLGRDLVCRKNGRVEVVQCKYWSQQKLIHEKHINQLFGTTVMLYLDSAVEKQSAEQQLQLFPQLLAAGSMKAVFYTSTELSVTARNFAQALNIEIHERVKLDIYPIIKCHISTATGAKIYHLPFDQMYDRTKLDKPSEFYALTVAEAEAKGFRRAWRWQG